MAERRNIIIGNQSNDGTGDSIRDAFDKVNKNFTDIYNLLGAGNGFSFLKLKESPSRLIPSNTASGKMTILGVDRFSSFTNVIVSAGTGISLTLYDDQIIINNTASSLSSQTKPQLGGNLDAQSTYNLINIRPEAPVADWDAVPRKWVYENFVSRNGGTELDVGGQSIFYTGTSVIYDNVNISASLTATSSTHLVSKGYVDGKVSLAGISTFDAETGGINPLHGQMTGALQLFRDPVETDHPFTAATKNYVDSTGFVSRTNFFVALSGNDNRIDIPSYKKGRGWNYAFKTINRAAQAAEQYLEASQITVGVYQKTISIDDNKKFATVSQVQDSTVIDSKLHGVQVAIEVSTQDGSDPYINGSIFPGIYILGARSGAIGRLEKISHDTGGTTGHRELYDISPVDYGLTFDTPLRPLLGSVNTGTVIFQATTPNLISFPEFWVGYKFTQTNDNGVVIAQGVITDVGDYYDPSGAVYDRVSVDFSDGIPVNESLAEIGDGVNTTATWHVYAPEFIVTETLIFGQRQVKEQISIMLESGEHEEQYPVKIGDNVSIRGDEFRRSVVKPAKLFGSQLAAISHSQWSNLKFYRDTQIDGIIPVQLDKTVDYAAPANNGASVYLTATPSSSTPEGGIITFAVNGFNPPSTWVGKVFYLIDDPDKAAADRIYNQGIITAVIGNTFSVNIAENSNHERLISNSANVPIVNSSTKLRWSVYEPINNGWHYLRDSSRPINVMNTLTNLGGFVNAASLLSENKEFIQDEIVDWFDVNFLQFKLGWNSTRQAKCSRDTKLILDSVLQDMLFNTTSQTTFAGIQYWAQSGYTGEIASEITTTTNTINYVRDLAHDVVLGLRASDVGLGAIATIRYATNTPQVRTNPADTAQANFVVNEFSTILSILTNSGPTTISNVTDNIISNGIVARNANWLLGYNILLANKTYIQEQAIAYVEANKTAGFAYNTSTCYRDVGYMIDSVAFDLLYDGNRQAIQSGVYYYSYTNTTNIPNESYVTNAAYQYLKTAIASYVTNPTALTTAQSLLDNTINIINNGPAGVTKTPISLTKTTNSGLITGATALYNAKDTLAINVLNYVNSQFNFSLSNYDAGKSRRDAGSIVSGLIEDLTLGGWWRTVNNGDSIVDYVKTLTTSCVATIRQIGVIGSKVLSNEVYDSRRVKYNVLGTYTNYSNKLWVSHDIAMSSYPGLYVVDSLLPNGYLKIVGVNTVTNLLTLDFKYIDLGEFGTTTTNEITITPQVINKTKVIETLADSRMRDLVQACAEIVADNPDFNPPKYTDEMDCFLMNDSTMIRYVSCQGHGGFMKVLDPTGQILAKSPYTQTASSFSKSYNRHVLSGGMFVDGFSGNISPTVEEILEDSDGMPTKIRVSNLGRPDPRNFGSYQAYLRPQTPSFFVNNGLTYEVDFISDWNPVSNTGILYLNPARSGGVYQVTGYSITGLANNSATIAVTFSAPDGAGGLSAYGTATTGPSGQVTSINVTYSGSGYKTTPTFTFGGALLSFTLGTNGEITNTSIIKPGGGYKVGTSINFNKPGTLGTAAVATVGAVNANGGITTATFTNYGLGYSVNDPPRYTFGTYTTTGTVELKTGLVVQNVPEKITMITAGNRSMLANDFTQLNDLGYGIFATNGGFIENVSMFTYYCRTSYYALNGAQMRTITGSSAYGDYGLVAEGSDPNEVPIPVTSKYPSSQIVTTYAADTFLNVKGGTSLYVTLGSLGAYTPLSQSKVDINHSGIQQSYNIRSATLVANNVYSLAIDDGKDGGLIEAVPAGMTATVRLYYNLELIGLKASAISRPSTVLTFDEDPNQVYRILSYTDKGNDTVLGESDTPYNYININLFSQSSSFKQGIGNVSWYNRGTVGATSVGIINSGTGYTSTTTAYPVTFTAPAAASRTAYIDGNQGTAAAPVTLINITGLVGTIHPGMTVTVADGLGFATPPTVNWVGVDQIRVSSPVYNLISGRAVTFSGQTATGQAWSNGNNITHVEILNHGSGYESLTTGLITISGGNGNATVRASIQGLSGANSIKVIPLSSLEAARITTGLASTVPYYYYFGFEGKIYRITGYKNTTQTGSPSRPADYAEVTFVLDSDGSSGLSQEMFPGTLFGGIGTGQSGGITVKISTLRATSHDMVAVGTGGYADSKIPNDLYGPPNKGPFPSQEVLQLGKGRVYFVTTDQDGNFRVGKFFGVDQGRGTVSISAPISLTNVDGISFRRGDTLVNRFSTDGTMAEESTNKVPVEQAIVTYVNKRLGIDKNSRTVGRIGPGFMPLDGSLPMTDSLNMAGNTIINVGMGGATVGTIASNKGWTDGKVSLSGTSAIDNDSSTFRPEWGRMDGPLWASADPVVAYVPGRAVINGVPAGPSASSTNLEFIGDTSLVVTGQIISSTSTGVTIPPGTTVRGVTGESQWTLSNPCIIPIGSQLILTDPPLQVPTKRYVDQRTQLATLNDVDLISPVDQDILMFTSTPRPISTTTLRPIWSATNQVTNVTLNTATITNNSTGRSGGSDITFARSGNSLTVKLVGGTPFGNNNPITDYHVNSAAQIQQSKLLMTVASTAAAAPTGTQQNIQESLGLAQFDNTYFSANNGWISFQIANNVFPTTSDTRLLGKSDKRWSTIYGVALDISNTSTLGGTLSVAGLTTLDSLIVTNNARVGGIFTSTGNLIVGANKFVVTAATGDFNAVGDGIIGGDLTIGGSTSLKKVDLSGDLELYGKLLIKDGSTTYFSVENTTGNTVIQGTLDVTGATNLKNTLNVAKNFTVATDKFSVNSSSGAISVAGSITGGGDLLIKNGLGSPTTNFQVLAASGNTNIEGTLSVSGVTTLKGVTTFLANAIVKGADLKVQDSSATDKFTVANATGNTNIEGTLTVKGDTVFSTNIKATIITATTFVGELTGNATSADKVNNALSLSTYLSYNSGSTFDGSAAKILRTNGTSSNIVSTLVARDGSGNFTAGTITATKFVGAIQGTVTGNADSATKVNNSLTLATYLSYDTGSTFDGSAPRTLRTNGTSTWSSGDAPNLVARDASGDFTAHIITAALNGVASSTNKINNKLRFGTASPYVEWEGTDSPIISYATVGAPSKTGTGASGSWAIDITGTAGSASSVAWGNVTNKPSSPSSTDWYSSGWPVVGSDGVMEIGKYIDFHSERYRQDDYDVRITCTGPDALTIAGTGTTTLTCAIFSGVATKARYADLAERYTSDTNYEPGTVLIFGGDAEVTQSIEANDRRIAGIVSSNPAYLMNSGLEDGVSVALTGRAPCRVVGTIKKGDLMVSSHIPGVAMSNDDPKLGTVIGKALEDYDSETVGLIEVVVGRL